MKYPLLATTFLTLTTSICLADPAQSTMPHRPELNRVHYQTSVEQWVTTSTALVTVGVDASLNQKGMDTMQQQVNDSLKTLAEGATWQMTDYERNQDASGLERVHIEEQTRLTSDMLVNLRSKTDGLSKPGIKYSINDIQFTPSLAEIQTVQDNLRAQLYTKIKQEIDRLDKTYDQTFYVHDVQFFTGDTPPVMPTAQGGANYKMMMVAQSAPQSTSMSQKLVMGADVTLASTIS